MGRCFSLIVTAGLAPGPGICGRGHRLGDYRGLPGARAGGCTLAVGRRQSLTGSRR
jgi:hypothetical protein